MYTLAGFVYDESDNKISGVRVDAYFIKRKSSSSPSMKKLNPLYTNASGYFSVNLADADFLTTEGKYDSVDEILIAAEQGVYYARIVHVINVSNEYNQVNLKIIRNKTPVMNYVFNSSGIVGQSCNITGTSYKNEASFQVTVAGVNITESQKRTYDIFEVFPKNTIVSTVTNWGDGTSNAIFSHTYNSHGNYTITVTSTDDYGDSNTQTFNARQIYNLICDNICDSNYIFNKQVSFNSEIQGNALIVYETEWYIDGFLVNANSTSINYIFTSPGLHQVKNKVYYSDGFVKTSCEKINTYTVHKLFIGVDALYSVPTSPMNEDVRFYATYLKDSVLTLENIDINKQLITSYDSTGDINFIRHFPTYGYFLVTLDYEFWNGFEYESNTFSYTIHVKKRVPENYNFNWLPLNPTINDEVEIEFYNEDQYVKRYDFSATNSVKINDNTFRFSSNSVVTMHVVFDNDWETEDLYYTNNLQLANIPPVAQTEVTPEYKKVAFVNFVSNSYDEDGNVVKWLWEIYNTDGTLLYSEERHSGSNLRWVCEEDGNYRVVLTVTDSSGDTGNVDVPFNITIPPCGNSGETTTIYVPYIDLIATNEVIEIIGTMTNEVEITVNLTDDALKTIVEAKK